LLGRQSGRQSDLQGDVRWEAPKGTLSQAVGFDTHLLGLGEVPSRRGHIEIVVCDERAAPVPEAPRAAVQGTPLSPTSQTLLEASEHHVRQVAEQHGLPWNTGLDNTAHAIAASARGQGMNDVNLFHVANGQIRYGQLDGAMLKDGVLDARHAANQPMAESLQRLTQLDRPQEQGQTLVCGRDAQAIEEQQEHQAYTQEPMARAV
jgi:hypothetical protein